MNLSNQWGITSPQTNPCESRLVEHKEVPSVNRKVTDFFGIEIEIEGMGANITTYMSIRDWKILGLLKIQLLFVWQVLSTQNKMVLYVITVWNLLLIQSIFLLWREFFNSFITFIYARTIRVQISQNGVVFMAFLMCLG